MCPLIFLINFFLIISINTGVNCLNKVEESDQTERIFENGSNSLQKLFEKIRLNADNQKELGQIKRLSQIIIDIKDFENKLLDYQSLNKTENKIDIVDNRIADFVTQAIVSVFKVIDIQKFWISLKEGIITGLSCLACHSIVEILFSRVFNVETLALAAINICSIFQLSDYDVCEGYVSSFKNPIDFIRHNTTLEKVEMCGLIMGDQCYIGKSNNLHWNLTLPEKSDQLMFYKPIIVSKIPRKMKFNILHLTDIHLDIDYVPFTGRSCNTPYCCRKSSTNPEPNMTANYWGSYPCDTPIHTLDNWFRNMNWGSIDWTYWTGDVVPHDSWQDTKFKSLRASFTIDSYLKTFSKNKLVVPAIGNHIAIPIGCFPPPLLDNEFSISWLYNYLAKQWSQWLPEEALDSVRYAGYYTLKTKPGFRVIVLNTNYCARLNIWTLYSSIDPANQLQWLSDQLYAAEKAGESVHIVGHIPPDNRECTQSWLFNYMAIVERYSDTIVGQFYGHTHWDEFRVLYSVFNDTKPIGLEIISPSLTTYIDMNPSYRIIQCDRNGNILDMNTFAFDLEQANNVHPYLPQWYHEYSMLNTYSIDSFDAKNFDSLIKAIETDEELLQTFYTLYHRNSSFVKSYCDKDCRTKIIYDTVIRNPFHQKPKDFLDIVVNINIKT